MRAVVRKWGNSLALRLPQTIASDLRMEDGTTVSLEIKDETLVVKPSRKRYSLVDLLKQMSDDKKHRETDWGKPEGKEVW